ncbi:hypothetical protein BaRGS_00031904 [Batillaria attramentaria]|uniref:Uncharacterized protein n=1 Tax=Batillaria attramentaria TaxID=370345 RepID=A0ABD0JQP0_9CAEN
MKIDINGYFCHASFILLLVLWPGICSGKPCKFPPLPPQAPQEPEITTTSPANTTSNDTESNTTENTTIDISTEKAFLSSSSNSNQRSLLVTIGIANIAVFLLLIFVVAGAIAFCYRSSLRTTDQPSSLHPEQQAAQREPMLAIERGESTISSQTSAGQFSLDRSSLHRSSSDQSSSSLSQSYSSDSSSTQRSSGESSNTYAEVNDESPRSSGDVPPPLPCRRPASLPADYLHPAHSLSAVQDAESALQNDVAMR